MFYGHISDVEMFSIGPVLAVVKTIAKIALKIGPTNIVLTLTLELLRVLLSYGC